MRLNGVLSMADEEVDVYLRQLSNKKKVFFLQAKTYKSSQAYNK